MPNGMVASKDDMLTGQWDAKQFVSAMAEYLDCIVVEEKQARSQIDEIEADEEQLREETLNKKINAAVEHMERIAAEYNISVQLYRELHNVGE